MQTLQQLPPLPAEDSALVGRDVFQPLTGFRNTAFFDRLKTGRLPSPMKLSSRCARWRVRDVRRYLEDPIGWERGHYSVQTARDQKEAA